MNNSGEKISRDFDIVSDASLATIKILAERLDALLAPRLKSELVVLAGSGVSKIVLDLNGIKYCDAAGLNSILVAHRLCRTVRGVFVLTGLSKEVERLLAISQLDSVLRVAYSADQVDSILAN